MFNARAAVYRGQTQAQSDLYEAKVAKANATNSLINGVVGSVSPIVSGWAKASQQNQLLNAIRGRAGDGSSGGFDFSNDGGSGTSADFAGLS